MVRTRTARRIKRRKRGNITGIERRERKILFGFKRRQFLIKILYIL